MPPPPPPPPPPNETAESPLLRVVKLAIALLSPRERADLRPWLLARYDVRGSDQQSSP